MQKGKFGFQLWLYPYISLWALFLEMNIIPFIIAGFVIAVEKDEWASKQCLHTVMICIYYSVYQMIMNGFIAVPLLGAVFVVIDGIVALVFFILVFILGFMKLRKGESISMFGMGLINQAYGFIQQAAPAAQYQQQYQQPQYQQQPQQQQPQQYAPPAQQNSYAPPAQAAPIAPMPHAPSQPPAYTPPQPPSGFAPPPPPPQN